MEMETAGPRETVREARDRYLAQNGFSMDTGTAPTVTVDVPFGRQMTFPNTRSRQKAVPLHDLHHVATGYGTDLIGEAEIGAWELVGGCNTLTLYGLNGSAFLFGMFLAPRRVLRALRRARGQRTLYPDLAPYDDLVGHPRPPTQRRAAPQRRAGPSRGGWGK